MSQHNQVLAVEVTDRPGFRNDRFEDVEVRVGPSSIFEDAISCGNQSYTNSLTYKYECPRNAVGKHIIIKKHGTTPDFVLHVDHVSVTAVFCPETQQHPC